jgi:hypothetical protein
LLFFYRKVFGSELPWISEIGVPRTKRRLPVVLSPDEVASILCLLEGEHRLFAQWLYGAGIRISEGLQLRVKDIDFGHGTIIVREGKGGKDRALMLPQRWFWCSFSIGSTGRRRIRRVRIGCRAQTQDPFTEIREVLDTAGDVCSVVPVSKETHTLGPAIAERHGFSIYDSMIVAAALLAGCETLVSEDMQDGQTIEGRLLIRNPFC